MLTLDGTGVFRGRKVGVVLGGDSDERDVSLRTGRALVEALKSLGYDVTVYDVPSDLGRLVADRPAAVLLGLHGGSGENGTMQGFLEALRIPYSGSGVLASALAMDKARAKAILRDADVPTPAHFTLQRSLLDDAHALAAYFTRIHGASTPAKDRAVWPQVLKINDGGSSVGVFLANDEPEFEQAVQTLSRMHTGNAAGDVLVEQYIDGDEFTVGIFGETALGAIQVVAANRFYDYEAKYQGAGTQYLDVAPGALHDRLVTLARRTYDALGCRGVARVDIMARNLVDRLSADRDLYVLEVNTIPGMTETSLVPKMARSLGLSFADFTERMLDSATLDDPR